MIYITGDTHGSYAHIEHFCESHNTTKDDILVILGDTGLNYYLNKKDDWLKEDISNLPITLFCIRGNHEARPENVGTYIVDEMFGDTVYYEPKYPNIIFAKDGGIYNIEGNRCLTIGGAYSVDKQYRVARGWMWFSDEQLTTEEIDYINSYIYKNPNYDYIFSHTCPYKTRPIHLFLDGIDQSTVDTSMEQWLDYVDLGIYYKKWYFGHYHGNWENKNFHMLYNDIIPLGE